MTLLPLSGSGGDVIWPGGGGHEHPERQDSWQMDESLLSLIKAFGFLCQRLPHPLKIPSGNFLTPISQD